jgi:hypothetical protein
MSSAAFAQTEASSAQELLGRKYGFTLTEPKDLVCDQNGMIAPSSDKNWYTLCESGFNTQNYVGVMFKTRNTNPNVINKNFGDTFMGITSDTTTRDLKCVGDKPKEVEGMFGFFADCVLVPSNNTQKPMYASFFYFSPKNTDILGKVIVFSDFGKGEKSHEAFKEAARASINANLKKVAQ